MSPPFRFLFLVFVFLPVSLLADGPTEALKNFQAQVQFRVLDNGMRVLVYERKNIAPVFNGSLLVNVGGVHESVGQTGISHMLEHMAFKGTSEIGTNDFSAERKLLEELEELAQKERAGETLSESEKERWQAIQKELEPIWDAPSYSMEIDRRGGVGLNATTSKEITRYFVSMPSSALEFWMWIEARRIFDPVMRQFYKERDVVLEERRMRYVDDSDGKLWEALMGTAFHVHPYRAPVIGYRDDISALTASETKDFHELYYSPSNMLLSVVGNVDGEEVFKLAEKYFGDLKPIELPRAAILEEPEQEGERIVNVHFDSAPSFAVAYKVPTHPNPDVPALSVMTELLNGTLLAPLQKELVEKRKVAISVGNFSGPSYGYPHLEIFWISPREGYSPKRVLKEFDDVIADFLKKEPKAEDLAVAKRRLGVSFMQNLRSNGSIAYLLGQAELMHGSWESVFSWYEEVREVTAADVQRVAKKYLQRDKRTVGVVGLEKEHIAS